MEELKNIEGKTIQSVTVEEEWNSKAVITFTDGTQIMIEFSEDPWGSSYMGIEFEDKQPAW